MIQQFLRNVDDTWTLSAISTLDQFATPKSIGIEVPLADVYERIDFSPESAASDNASD